MSKKLNGVEEGASPSVVESGEEAIGVAVVEKVLGKRAISELDGAGGRVACFSVDCLGSPENSDVQNVNPGSRRVAKHYIFADFRKISKVAEFPPG